MRPNYAPAEGASQWCRDTAGHPPAGPRFTVAKGAVCWLFGCGIATLLAVLGMLVRHAPPSCPAQRTRAPGSGSSVYRRMHPTMHCRRLRRR
jgi:hypothetical protein